ncbi:hypothetical protein GW17_00027679 [Ensete ventricosum]|nr:hypothetical protein GW17_00027679 [Ensete ventricosum]RZS25403.1 hypothetical protein BHM03_00058598 [Ensete ventricosum]
MTSTRSTRTWWRPARSKKTIEHPRSNIIMQRKYGPQLTMPVLIPFFQQPTGINVIMFYAPVSFETVGFGDDASLPRAHRDHWPRQCLRHLFVSIATVDKLGRRLLFLQAGALIALGEAGNLRKTYASVKNLFSCIYVAAAFAWSWRSSWLAGAS